MTDVMDDLPVKYYKYRSMSGDASTWAERIVLHNEIYFPPASSFNDPFDLRPVFSLQATPDLQREDFLRLSRKYEPNITEEERVTAADRVMATSMSTGDISGTTAAIQAVHNHNITTIVGVLCVSTKPDNILMWSHYADSHRGICLEFDGTLEFMADAQKVQYTFERFPINPYYDNREAMMKKALLTKSDQWSYESEWRLFCYDDGPGIIKFQPANLTGIIIGALASPSTVDMVMRWGRQRAVPINLYRASVSHKKFELHIDPARL